MKKKEFIVFTSVLIIMMAGCGKEKVSNENITVSKYKGLEIEQVKDEDDVQAIKELEDNIWEVLMEQCIVQEYPEDELKELIQELKVQYGYVAHHEGIDAEELIKERTGFSVEELAKQKLKKKYVVELIVEKENLQLTSDEYNEELKKRAEKEGISDVQMYENMVGREELKQTILEERVMNFLKENAK